MILESPWSKIQQPTQIPIHTNKATGWGFKNECTSQYTSGFATWWVSIMLKKLQVMDYNMRLIFQYLIVMYIEMNCISIMCK